MYKFLPLEEEAFGLDIDDSSLKIVKLIKRGSGFALVSYNSAKIPASIIQDGVIKDEVALTKILSTAYNSVKGKKIKTKYAVASLPEEKSFSQVIQMPKMGTDDLRSAVPIEAENYIPLSIDDVYLDFCPISTGKNYLDHSEVQIVASPKKIVDSYFSCLKKAGFKVLAFELESEAIVRALVKTGDNSSLLVLVDFGENGTNLIIYSNGSVRFASSIPISSAMLTQAITDELKISSDKAEALKIEHGILGKNGNAGKLSQAMFPTISSLANNINKCINYYIDHSYAEYFTSTKKVEKILLSGGGSELKGLEGYISKNLGIPVELGDPLINFASKKPKNIIRKDLLSYTTAIGLALRKLGGDF